MADALQIKRKIVTLINSNGPTLPVQIARETGLSILFASAFLSELFNEKEIKMSHLRVGSSALYYIEGQEAQLEKYSQYLKSKEKDAFILLKEKNILKDAEQSPAIRVALREIKDFAIPFENNGEWFWRYFLITEPEETQVEIIEIKEVEEIKEEPLIEIKEVKEKEEAPKKESKAKKPKKESKAKKPGKNDKKDENFFNKIKEFLEKKKVEIIDIKDFKNDEAILKVKKNGAEELLFVFNKKKITEKEVIKAYKKANDNKMKYSVLSLGETPKKLEELISAMKTLSDIGKIE